MCRSSLSAVALLLAVVGDATPVAAQTNPGTSAAPSAVAPRPAPITALALSLEVDVEPGAAGLDADALRGAIAREAQVFVTSAAENGAPRLLVRSHGETGLRFELVDPTGRHVERTIDLADEAGEAPSHRLDTAALVAASLLEDEASELLATLRSSAASKPAAAPPPSPKAPAEGSAQHVSTLNDACVTRPELVRPIGADLFPHVGTSRFEPPGTVRRASIELVGGTFEGVSGVQFSPLLSFGGKFLCGAGVSVLGGWIDGPLRGVTVSGLFERTGEIVYGASVAGLLAVSSDVTGAQVAGGATWAENLRGVQGAGVSTIVRSRVQGVQVTGGVAWASDVAGLQWSGVASVALERMRGVQVSPISLAGDVRGLQVGAFNLAGPVRGVQVGVINVARTSDASLGLVSIVTEGRTNLQTFASSDGVVSTALQHGGRWVHNFYGGSISFAGQRASPRGPCSASACISRSPRSSTWISTRSGISCSIPRSQGDRRRCGKPGSSPRFGSRRGSRRTSGLPTRG